MAITEWDVRLTRDETSGAITAALYEIQLDGQYRLVSDEAFGPFDTALDVCSWITRHWSPRARLLLR